VNTTKSTKRGNKATKKKSTAVTEEDVDLLGLARYTANITLEESGPRDEEYDEFGDSRMEESGEEDAED
jgi:hypothetical protein